MPRRCLLGNSEDTRAADGAGTYYRGWGLAFSAWLREPDGGGTINQEQREFFDEVLTYLRNELDTRLDPQTVTWISKIHGPAYALRDKMLAKQGRVYLADRRGRQRTKSVDELRPYDLPDVLRKIEANIPNAPISKRWRKLRRGWMR